MGSPPKPWEQGSTLTQSTGGGLLDSANSLNGTAQTQSSIGSSVPLTSSTAASISPGAYSSPTGPYGPMSSQYGYGASTAAGAYGSPYGSSMYGSSPYGAGYGSSMYSGGYGGGYGGSLYGGGYGGSMGGYGGYGMGGYSGYGGGYGGAYGGYGGLSRYGGGYGMGGGGGMGMLGQEMGWLGGLHQTIGSMGQISELLGMNAEAMQFAFSAFGNFLERIGGVTQEVFGFFMGTPPPSPIDPRTGQPLPHLIDPRTGQPIMDPRTGQPVRIPTPEEFKIERKRRFIRWVIGVAVVYLGFRFVRALFRSRSSHSSSGNPALNAAFQEVTSRHVGGGLPPAYGGFGFDSGAPGPIYPAIRGGGMVDAFENAFGRKTIA